MITDRRLLDPALRAALVVAAALVAALGAPTAVRTVLVAAAAVAVAGSAVRRRALGRLDALVIGLAGVLAVLVLLGLLLNLFPAGLTRVSWAIGAGVLGLGAVAFGSRTNPGRPSTSLVSRSTLLRQGPWVVAAAGVAAVAVVIAVHATDVANRAPVQLSVTRASADSVAVRVQASHTTAQYQIVVLSDAVELNRSAPFRVDAGQHVDYRFAATGTRVTVDLRKVTTGVTSRSLVVDPSAGGPR